MVFLIHAQEAFFFLNISLHSIIVLLRLSKSKASDSLRSTIFRFSSYSSLIMAISRFLFFFLLIMTISFCLLIFLITTTSELIVPLLGRGGIRACHKLRLLSATTRARFLTFAGEFQICKGGFVLKPRSQFARRSCKGNIKIKKRRLHAR